MVSVVLLEKWIGVIARVFTQDVSGQKVSVIRRKNIAFLRAGWYGLSNNDIATFRDYHFKTYFEIFSPDQMYKNP